MENMKCSTCGGQAEKTKFGYRRPDKYESWVGLEKIKRLWVRCKDCGFYWQLRNYPMWQLEHIYKSGYRNPKFRGETIKESFDRLRSIKNSENENRYIWFAMNIKYREANRVLDIGSGIGVWPAILKDADFDITCVEKNSYSVDFIKSELDLECYTGLSSVVGKFDTVTLVHVLEHIEMPDIFLKDVREYLRPNGYLFVEIPDPIEFEYLEKSHDEFNSCHVSFYDIANLYKLLERNGYMVTNMHRVRYEDRNLSRIMCLAINI